MIAPANSGEMTECAARIFVNHPFRGRLFLIQRRLMLLAGAALLSMCAPALCQIHVATWEANQDNYRTRGSIPPVVFQDRFYAHLLTNTNLRHVQIGPVATPQEVRSLDKPSHRSAIRLGTTIEFSFQAIPMTLPEPIHSHWITLCQIHGYKEAHDRQVGHQIASLRARSGRWQLHIRVRGDAAVASGSMSTWSNPGEFYWIDTPIEIGKPIWLKARIKPGHNRQGKTQWWYKTERMIDYAKIVDSKADNYFRSQYPDLAGWDLEVGNYRDARLKPHVLILYEDISETWLKPRRWPIPPPLAPTYILPSKSALPAEFDVLDLTRIPEADDDR